MWVMLYEEIEYHVNHYCKHIYYKPTTLYYFSNIMSIAATKKLNIGYFRQYVCLYLVYVHSTLTTPLTLETIYIHGIMCSVFQSPQKKLFY